jgi:hypothetical protein
VKPFGETPEGYHDGMMVPLEMLSAPYEEINLWFEFDLHCQVNLLGAMMLLEPANQPVGTRSVPDQPC